jgi:hypothetical protein
VERIRRKIRVVPRADVTHSYKKCTCRETVRAYVGAIAGAVARAEVGEDAYGMHGADDTDRRYLLPNQRSK